MKRIRIIELLAEIRANLVAFISIAMFVALGMALFLGIHWGSVASTHAVQDVASQYHLHDIEVSFPYGITQSDLGKIKQVEGVSNVETGYTSFASMADGNMSYTLKVQTLTKDIDLCNCVEGVLPSRQGEVALLSFWANDQGLKVGDTIRLKHDAKSADDKDGMEYLTTDTYKITGLVENPAYIRRTSEAIGISNTASGTIDCVAFVVPGSVDASKYHDGYSSVYITCDTLKGIETLSDEYQEKVSPIMDAITKLGGTLASARYEELHGEAQQQIDDAQKKLEEGERAIAEGKEQIAEGERAIAEGKEQLESGEKELVDGVVSATGQQSDAQKKLDDAYRQLADGQAKYDAAVQTYNTMVDLVNQANSTINAVSGDFDRLVAAVNNALGATDQGRSLLEPVVSAYNAYVSDPTDGNWASVDSAYASFYNTFSWLSGLMGDVQGAGGSVSSALGMPLSLDGFEGYSLPSSISADNAAGVIGDADGVLAAAQAVLDRIRNASITIGDTRISLLDIPTGLQNLSNTLANTKTELERSKATLDAGWSEYNRNKKLYDDTVAAGQAKLTAGQTELEEGRSTIADKERELKEGRSTIADKEQELKEGKEQFADAQAEFQKMTKYEWIVLSRRDSGGMQNLKQVNAVMGGAKWAMALLFVLVGLFVCYSAVSRLVHEQITRLGTKKALGFRNKEISSLYYAFVGLTVVAGVLISLILAIFVVQGILNPVVAGLFSVPSAPAHCDVLQLLLVSAIELALIVASTWFAIRSLLKRSAIDLLRGENTGSAKERFYEKWPIWKRMSLFSQTVVNNCINDTRRMVATLVGVVGCTTLIVVAVTLANNVSKSLELHYQDVYSYNAMAFLSDESEKNAESVALSLYRHGIGSTPAFTAKMQVRQDDGQRSVAALMVPTNEEAFKKYYHVVSTSGEEVDLNAGGIWVSAAYSEHMGVEAGDALVLTDSSGQTHTFKVAGAFNYYLVRQEFVLGMDEYKQAFGRVPEPNVVLADAYGVDLNTLRDDLAKVDGYSSLVNDRESASKSFNTLARVLNIVVLVYLLLSALMSLVVLLNLDMMFVNEKKRELIILMINGFSTGQAKAYIYRDSLVLTFVGIVLGIVLGAIVGSITVFALEPSTGYWLKGFNGLAAVAGAVGAGAFAIAVLWWSLRQIPKFDLTDINRF